MNITKDRFSLILLSTVLALSLVSINFCTKISSCALLYTIATISVFQISTIVPRKQTIYILSTAALLSLIISFNQEYRIAAKTIEYLVPVSLFSILFSTLFSLNVFAHLYSRFSFTLAAMSAILVSAAIDGCIMSVLLINYFSIKSVLTAFISEIGYKLLYCGSFCTIRAFTLACHRFIFSDKKVFKN